VAHAQLGQVVQGSDAAAVAHAMRQSTTPWTSTVSKDANGVTITQYVNTQGVVFAVTWNGPVKPDLQQLLGSYFSSNGKVNPIGNVSDQSQGDLVVVSSGAMPHFTGYAYLKSDTPAGFTFN
jgi:hypothetical protein